MNPSKLTSSTAPPPPPKSNEDRRHHNHQRVVVPHILLGITGSVAAVKGPELAVALARQLHAHIIVLMSRGGMSFWDRSAELYNPVVWKDYLSLLVSNSDGDGVQSFMSADNGRRNGDLRQDDAVDKQSNNDDGMSVGDDGTENSHNGKIMLVSEFYLFMYLYYVFNHTSQHPSHSTCHDYAAYLNNYSSKLNI